MPSPRTTVFFDVETGGVEEHHPVIQIAAVAIRGWKEVGLLERTVLFNEWAADPSALELNSYDPARWAREAVNEAQAASDFSNFLRAHADVEKVGKKGTKYRVARIAGHNITRFDIPKMLELFRRHGEFFPADWTSPLDTLSLARWCFGTNGAHSPMSHRLSVLAHHFGIPHEQAHDALSDVRTNIAVADRLLSHIRANTGL